MTRTAEAETAATARDAAAGLLAAVLWHRTGLDDALDRQRAMAALATRDRAFARLLAATTLRRLGEIDRAIGRLLPRPLPARAEGVRLLLRLGLCQLLFLGSAPHAAVNETVAQAHRRGLDGFAPLLNAVLRRAASDPALLRAEPAEAGRLNTPDWLWRRWCAAYGEATAQAIAAAHLREPPLDLTARDDPRAVARAVGGTLLPTGSVRLAPSGAITELPGYAEGRWWVQDAAAALPARLLGDVAGKPVVDLCAAPGGKTAQLAAAGGRVTAVDRAPRRVARLRQNLARLRLTAATVIADAAAWRPPEPADAVLLDAPCSATGTIRRHPDVPHLKRPDDVAALAQVQQRLIAAAAAMLRPGGVFVYAACSLEPEEGERQIRAALGSGAPFVRRPIAASEVGGLAQLLTADGDLRSLPCHLGEQGGMDGFFAARLVRV